MDAQKISIVACRDWASNELAVGGMLYDTIAPGPREHEDAVATGRYLAGRAWWKSTYSTRVCALQLISEKEEQCKAS